MKFGKNVFKLFPRNSNTFIVHKHIWGIWYLFATLSTGRMESKLKQHVRHVVSSGILGDGCDTDAKDPLVFTHAH